MILPSSIRNCNRDMLKGNFNVSFVYVFTNIFNGKMYIGFHVSKEGDNYWHSSTCEEFGLAFNKTEPTFDYEIIAVGTPKQMQNKEHELLTEVNAKSNPDYYNKSNGIPAYKEIRYAKCEEFVRKFKAGEFEEQNELISELVKLERLQVRFTDDSKHITEIADLIKEAGGDTSKCSLILLWGEGSHRKVGDGNHTISGAEKAKHAKTLRTVSIKDEDHDFTLAEKKHIGRILNRNDDGIINKYTDTQDGAKALLERELECGIKVDDYQDNFEYLKILGFDTTKRKKAVIKAALQLKKDRVLEQQGRKWIDWAVKAYKDKLEQKVSDRKDRNTICFSMSSGMTNKFWPNLMEHLFNTDLNEQKPYIDILITHPTVAHEKAWVSDFWPLTNQHVEKLFKSMGKVPILNDKGKTTGVEVYRRVRIIPMDTEISDGSNS